MFRDSLVAIDGSAHGARALVEAVDLAERDNARLTLLTCVPDPSAWLLSGAGYAGAIDYVGSPRKPSVSTGSCSRTLSPRCRKAFR